MNTFLVLRSLAVSALGLAGLALSACATPQQRAQDNPAIIQGLSAQDRALALNGQIRLGMDKQAVFIALGRPDRTVRGVSKSGEIESWVFTTTQTAYVGYYGAGWGPGFGWGPGWRRGWGGWRGGGWGGWGGWGSGYYWGSPGFYSPWVYYQVPHQRVLFAKDRVVGYEVVNY